MTAIKAKSPGGPGAGRPHYRPSTSDRVIVKFAAALGLPHEEIAAYMNDGAGITAKTLRKHFRKELDFGAFQANVRIGGELFDLAINCPDPTIRYRASAFLAERRFGLRPVSSHKVTGAGGGPVEQIISIEFSGPDPGLLAQPSRAV